MLFRMARVVTALVAVLAAAGCGGLFPQKYEYAEEIALNIDGSAIVSLSASEAALVALRGAPLDAGPHARPDRAVIRTLFDAPGVTMRTPTFTRRDGRRFVHVTLEIADVAQLNRVAPFAWSTYRLTRAGDALVFRQTVGRPVVTSYRDPGWTGNELVAFKMHIPSRVVFENATSNVERGNILVWEQLLTDRLAGVPIDLEVQMESESILRHTLLLFGVTIVAAAATFAAAIWWVVRRGRRAAAADGT
jgi:hypothetical protein